MTHKPPFNREERYTVLKISDVSDALSIEDQETLVYFEQKIDAQREARGKAPLQCVVVEKDWPEYEPTWKAIEARVAGAAPAAEPPEMAEIERAIVRAEGEAMQAMVIRVEKMLCAKLGRQWSPSGISIESLIEALAARPAVPDEALPDFADGSYADGFNKGWNACRAAMLAANPAPAVPDGYVLVKRGVLEDFRTALAEYTDTCETLDAVDELLTAAPKPGDGT